jgi:hypothetical protein
VFPATRPISAAFRPDDAVLFLALQIAGCRACSLADVIGLYDLVNRAIPSAEMLDGGLNRLIEARLVTLHRGRFVIPPKVIREFDAFRRRRRKDRFATAAAFVAAAGPLRSVPRCVMIRASDHGRAYNEYPQRYAEAL